jgi:hypothetical protein
VVVFGVIVNKFVSSSSLQFKVLFILVIARVELNCSKSLSVIVTLFEVKNPFTWTKDSELSIVK